MNRTLYDLTPAQNLIFAQKQATFKQACMNIPISLIIKQKLDMNLLEESLKKTIQRWDSFGIRIIQPEKGVYKQYFTDRDSLGIVQKDFTGKSHKHMEAFFAKESKRGIPIKDVPMARFFIIRTPEGHTGFFSIINHMIMDSWSISLFHKDVMDVYFSLSKGEPMPKPMKDYEPLLVKELEFLKSPEYKKLCEYWEQEFKQPEPFYTHPSGLAMLEKTRKKKGRENARFASTWFPFAKGKNDIFYISPEDTKKMQDFLVREGLNSMASLYHMGLRTYLAKVNGEQEDIGFIFVMARRATLHEKLCGGNRVGSTYLRTIMPKETTFLEGLNQITDKNMELYRYGDVDYMKDVAKYFTENYKAPLAKGYYSTLLTYQPMPMETNGLEIETRWHSNGASAMPLYITIMDADGSGGLKCYFEHITKQISKETVKNMHDYITKVILAGIENPSITLEELYRI